MFLDYLGSWKKKLGAIVICFKIMVDTSNFLLMHFWMEARAFDVMDGQTTLNLILSRGSCLTRDCALSHSGLALFFNAKQRVGYFILHHGQCRNSEMKIGYHYITFLSFLPFLPFFERLQT